MLPLRTRQKPDFSQESQFIFLKLAGDLTLFLVHVNSLFYIPSVSLLHFDFIPNPWEPGKGKVSQPFIKSTEAVLHLAMQVSVST